MRWRRPVPLQSALGARRVAVERVSSSSVRSVMLHGRALLLPVSALQGCEAGDSEVRAKPSSRALVHAHRPTVLLPRQRECSAIRRLCRRWWCVHAACDGADRATTTRVLCSIGCTRGTARRVQCTSSTPAMKWRASSWAALIRRP